MVECFWNSCVTLLMSGRLVTCELNCAAYYAPLTPDMKPLCLCMYGADIMLGAGHDQ